MFKNISLWQILIVVLIIALLFGARKLPDLASSVGKSLKIFKKEITELRDDDDDTNSQPPAGPTSSSTDATTPTTGTQQSGRADAPSPSAASPGGSDNTR